MFNNVKSILSGAGACLLTATLLISCGKGKEAAQIPEGKAVKGTFYVDLYEEGEIEAVNSINISSPSISWRYGNLKITNIINDGEEVVTGDTVIIFDQTEVRKAIEDAESRLEISLAELQRLDAQNESSLEELKADYEVSRIALEISKIKLEQAQFESDVTKRELGLNLEKADIALDRALEQLENQKKIQGEERKQKTLSIRQDEQRITEAYQTLDMLNVIAPSPGIAIINENWSTSNKFQVGDQCWPATPLIQLPNLTSLKAKVRINEVDIAKITKGLKVEIKPDAFSENTFTGTVNTVANLAVNKSGSSKIKVFPVEIVLNETHENLLPGLTVSCRIIVDEIEDALYVSLSAVHSEGDKYFVYKKRAGKYERVDVETGASNSDYVIITAGLDEGDTVALVDPFATPEQEQDKETPSEEA